MFRPSTLTSAIGLARLQESKVGARRGLNRSDVPSPPAAPAKKVVNPTRPIFPRMKRPYPVYQLSRLSVKGRVEAKSWLLVLYSNCEEKFHPGREILSALL